jgi:hypothetical protein
LQRERQTICKPNRWFSKELVAEGFKALSPKILTAQLLSCCL